MKGGEDGDVRNCKLLRLCGGHHHIQHEAVEYIKNIYIKYSEKMKKRNETCGRRINIGDMLAYQKRFSATFGSQNLTKIFNIYFCFGFQKPKAFQNRIYMKAFS